MSPKEKHVIELTIQITSNTMVCIFNHQQLLFLMVNGSVCTTELWCTREVAKHERSERVAGGDSFLSA